MKEALRKYVLRGYRSVDGWLSAIAIKSVAELGALQKRLGIGGAVSEIGVHHGRLFILLHLLTDPPEISVAWDLFEWQHQNADGSGRGDSRILRTNLTRHGCDLSRIKINTVNSLTLKADKILADCENKVRIFSVDGGHTAESTHNDLRLAADTLCEGGLILLDDFFNADWPGVAEGASSYLHSHKELLCPVAIVGNKFIFTNTKTMAKIYSQGLYDLHGRSGCSIKTTSAFGGEILTITPYGAARGCLIDRTLDYGSDTRMWKSLRYTTTGRFLKLVLRQMKDV